ncbi:MAG: hypothetical protein HQL56_02240 [Magnetococcales bacterium]|nr:hypothetical protein [Magnetococcales bacterium]
MKNKYSLSPRTLLHQVADGNIPRIIDFRGNYEVAIPTTIPARFDPDIFFEEEAWVQDMLGVPFSNTKPVVLVCEYGNSAEVAIDYFFDKNPRSRFQLFALKKGWQGYLAHVDKLTGNFRKGAQFKAELIDLTTSERRFTYLVKGLYTNLGPFWKRLFF